MIFVNISEHICNSYRHAVICGSAREAAWISIYPHDPSSGAKGCRRSSTRKCCRATAPGSITPRPAAKPHRSWASCSARRARRDCGISAFPNSLTTSRGRGFPISNMRRWPRSWDGCSGPRRLFNCQAPDVPNMIALQNCATPEQKARWLRPLLEAETRSAFGMTEPDVASSDATNIATTIVRDSDDYIINGPQMVHHRRRASALQFPDRARRDQCGRRPHPPPFLRHCADGYARRPPGPAAALDGLRGSRRPDRRTRLRQCPYSPIEPARRREARVSRSPRSVSARRASIIACARSGCASF